MYELILSNEYNSCPYAVLLNVVLLKKSKILD